jgi:hypothetical protein
MGVYNGIKIQNKQEKYKKKDCPTFRTASVLSRKSCSFFNSFFKKKLQSFQEKAVAFSIAFSRKSYSPFKKKL